MIYLLLYLTVSDIPFHPLIFLLYNLTLIFGISLLLLDPYHELYLSFPKYVVLKSEFLSNLVVSAISDLTP